MFTTDLDQLLPHQPPMRVIDAVLEKTAEYAKCVVVISQQSLFYDATIQGIYAWLGIEFMAQAIGVFAGLHQYPAKADLGLLLSVRKFTTQQAYFAEGQVLTIVAHKGFLHDNVAVFNCEIMIEDIVIASAILNTIVPPPDKIAAILTGQQP